MILVVRKSFDSGFFGEIPGYEGIFSPGLVRHSIGSIGTVVDLKNDPF